MTICCWDLRNVPGKPSCCGSCHDEVEDGYYDYMSGDWENWSICCAVNTWLEQTCGIDTLEPADENHEVVKQAREAAAKAKLAEALRLLPNEASAGYLAVEAALAALNGEAENG